MFEGYQIKDEVAEILIPRLKSEPHLSPSNTNITIVELGRFSGKFTEILRKAWFSSRIFSFDDAKELLDKDPQQYLETMRKFRDSNVTVIQDSSPPRFAWPKAWAYDLLVIDINSNYTHIRDSLRWWAPCAKRYSDGTRGTILADLPKGTPAKQLARELFIEEEDITVEKVVGSWTIIKYNS